MEANSNRPFQIFVKLLDGKTATLRFPTSTAARAAAIKHRIQDITRIPTGSQRLICGGAQLSDQSVVSTPESTVHLLLRLVGGKGGFGSLLRGAGNKAGKKKTKNFDACRDMSGRRLRHVNHEKMIEEWKNEEEERKYERLAMEHLKQRAKQGKKGVGDGEAQKYVEEYREESAKCSAEVEMAVREACMNANGKRKGKAKVERLHAKRLKLWIGGLGRSNGSGSESEDNDDDNDDEAEENQKPVVLNNGNYSGSSKEADGSLDSDAGEKQVGDCSGAAFSDSSSKEEMENADDQSPKSEVLHNDGNEMVEPEILKETREQVAISTGLEAEEVSGAAVVKELAGSDSSSGNGQVFESGLAEGNSSPDSKSESIEETAVANGNDIELEKLLNFHEYNSAAELEVLGMERLKTELQTRGLKCGGTLQERAARLFLLKSTPLDKLPKKLLAKK